MPSGRFGVRVNSEASAGFGAWIRENRIANNITLTDLADIIGVSRATLNNWEMGHSDPTMVTKYGMMWVFEHIAEIQSEKHKSELRLIEPWHIFDS